MRWLIIFVLCFFSKAYGQLDKYSLIGIDQGLSQGMVYDMIQDKSGFIWFATKDGLNRYDGYNFKVFTHDGYNPKSISGNVITRVLQDSKGRIWVGTQRDGLNLYDEKTQSFYNVKIADNELKNAGNYEINQLIEDVNGDIWVILRIPNKYFRIKTSAINSKAIDLSKCISVFKKKDEVVAENFKINNSPFEINIFSSLFQDSLQENSLHKELPYTSHVLCDKNKMFWAVKNSSQLLCFKKEIIKKIDCEEPLFTNAIFNLYDGSIAVLSTKHVWIFQPEELLKINKLTVENAYMDAPIFYDYCNKIMLDNAKNIWFSTSGYGLVKFNSSFKKFNSYLPGATLAGLVVNKQNEVFLQGNFRPSVNYYKLNKTKNEFEGIPSFFASKMIHLGLCMDELNNYWILENGINPYRSVLTQFDENKNFKKKFALPNVLSMFSIHYPMCLGKQNQIWIAGINGLLISFNKHTEKFSSYQFAELLPKAGAEIISNFLYPSNANTLWICTDGGLVKISNCNVNPIFTLYKNEVNNSHSISNNIVSSCVLDPRDANILWVSTKGGGLEKMNIASGKFEHFTTTQGLSNNVVYGVLLGADSNLWMSTNRGISKLNLKTYIFSTFNKSDGLQDNEFNTFSFANGNNGQLVFGGINGVTIFDPKDFQNTNYKPIVKIIGLTINNKNILPNGSNKILQQDIGFQKNIELSFNQNQVGLEMCLMDFTNPLKNKFKYQMVGLDKEWVESGSTHTANYAQIPSGHYTFRVMGTVDGDVWSNVQELQIIVNPPWYRTWWAYCIYALLVCFGAFKWFQEQIRKVQLREKVLYKEKEAKQLLELDQLKTNFFANISHEIRTPLTLILAPSEELVARNPTEILYTLINRNANRLLQLINQILDISKLEAGQMKVNAENVELVSFLTNLFADFQNLASIKKIKFAYKQNLLAVNGYIDTDKVSKIIYNLLSNAIKFTNEGGKIVASVEYSANQQLAIITVKDSGIGLSQEKLSTIFNRFYQSEDELKAKGEGTGIGLALVKELVELLNASITVTSKIGEGSTFIVRLPVNYQKINNQIKN